MQGRPNPGRSGPHPPPKSGQHASQSNDVSHVAGRHEVVKHHPRLYIDDAVELDPTPLGFHAVGPHVIPPDEAAVRVSCAVSCHRSCRYFADDPAVHLRQVPIRNEAVGAGNGALGGNLAQSDLRDGVAVVSEMADHLAIGLALGLHDYAHCGHGPGRICSHVAQAGPGSIRVAQVVDYFQNRVED